MLCQKLWAHYVKCKKVSFSGCILHCNFLGLSQKPPNVSEKPPHVPSLSLYIPRSYPLDVLVDVRYNVSPLSTTVHRSNSLKPPVFSQQSDYRQIFLFSSVCLQKPMCLLSFPRKDCSGFLNHRPYDPYRSTPLMTVAFGLFSLFWGVGGSVLH